MLKQWRNGDAGLGRNRRRTMTPVEWCQIQGKGEDEQFSRQPHTNGAGCYWHEDQQWNIGSGTRLAAEAGTLFPMQGEGASG